MRARVLSLAALTLLPWRLPAHDLLRSEAALRADGKTVRIDFTLNLFELTSPVVPGNPRASPAQLERSIEPIFDSVLRRFSLRSTEPPIRCDLGQYTLIDGNAVHMEMICGFGQEVRSLAIESTLWRIMPPGHRTFVSARLNGGVGQAILDAANGTAVFTGLQPGAWLTMWRFGRLGVEHIFTGYDHLAFLLGLLVATAALRSLVAIVTSFTLAHSVTLALATLDVVVLPPRLTESLIALSIAWIAGENLLGLRVVGRRYITFLFGLVHGFGFSNVLRELQLPSSGVVVSLFSFNLGVEIGQIAFVALVFPFVQDLASSGWRRLSPAVSAGIGSLGVYWFVQRAFGL